MYPARFCHRCASRIQHGAKFIALQPSWNNQQHSQNSGWATSTAPQDDDDDWDDDWSDDGSSVTTQQVLPRTH